MGNSSETSGEKTFVNIGIDPAELDEIKALTGVESNATAILAAARHGRDFLKKSKEMVGQKPVVVQQRFNREMPCGPLASMR